jgi:BRCA1-associated protein
MDETTGLLTILCQHVFHCTCLQKWSGGGCPVCRYTHDDFSSRLGGHHHAKNKKKKILNSKGAAEFDLDDYDGYGVSGELECETCHIEENLWQCLICGKVGCGRYEGKHAYAHYEESGHTFSMDLESKRVWDYGGDGYVHRIVQDAHSGAPGEKLVELPGSRREGGGATALNGRSDQDEWGMKMEDVALEYTHLLTSQLESQRVYFEEVVERAVDKASEAGRRAGEAGSMVQVMRTELEEVRGKLAKLNDEVVPGLQKERDRAVKRSERFEGLSREMEKRYAEEKTLVGNLMERISWLEGEADKAKTRVAELEEENRDLMLNFSMAEKVREIAEMDGEGSGADVVEGIVGIVEQQKEQGGGTGRRKKGKGKR